MHRDERMRSPERGTAPGMMALLCIVVSLVAGFAVADPEPPGRAADLASFESLVAKRIELSAAAAQEQREWAHRKEEWRRERELLAAENDRLSARLVDVEKLLADEAAQIAAVETDVESLRDASARLLRAVETAEIRLNGLLALVPAPLLEPVTREAAALENPATLAGDSLNRRLRRVLVLFTHVETLHNSFNRAEIAFVDDRGDSATGTALFAGLAAGYVVYADGERAAVGVPSVNGWTWERRDEMAAAVRKALLIQSGREPAQWVRLPVQTVTLEDGE